MVNIDQETFFETRQKCALDAVAFEQDDRVVSGYGVGLNGALGEWKILINARDAIMHDDFRIFAHNAQNLAARQGRANAVSIRPRVRGNDEAATRPNFL